MTNALPHYPQKIPNNPSPITQPRHIRQFLLATSLTCLLSACAHIDSGNGVEFHFDKLDQLHKGMSMNQVEQLLGKPLAIENKDNQITYEYIFGNVKAFKMILINSSRNYENATAHLVFKDQVLEPTALKLRSQNNEKVHCDRFTLHSAGWLCWFFI